MNMIEIERKFLLKDEVREVLKDMTPIHISQAYLVNEKSKSVRVRIMNDLAYLTVKSDMIGITRSEYEYEIPVQEALSMIKSFELKVLQKVRYKLEFHSKTWEIDVFEGALKGLVLAEIELQNENESFERPLWIGEEVTFDPTYLNANLINRL